MKLTRTQEKCADLKSLGYTNQEISSRLNIHIKTVEFHMANIKARKTTTQTRAVPAAILKNQWYLMPSNRLAQVVSVSADFETITVDIHIKGTFKRELGETNQADFTRKFVRRNWKLWDASKGRIAQ